MDGLSNLPELPNPFKGSADPENLAKDAKNKVGLSPSSAITPAILKTCGRICMFTMWRAWGSSPLLAEGLQNGRGCDAVRPWR